MASDGGNPLLSVVIPTRNRQEYAVSSVASILRIPDRDLEIVVQDNSDTRELEGLLQQHAPDSRLQYCHTRTPLSFIGNFDAAVSMAKGEYLCVIGDDDGVMPEIMEATRWARDNGLDTLKPAVCAHYLWPASGIASTMFRDVPQETGELTILPFSGRVICTDNEKEMRKVMRRGGQEYLQTEMPRFYHGIVRRQCLKRVCEKTGAYFGGLSPDIYAAMAISNMAKNSAAIDYPLTLPGSCRKSGAVAGATGKHTGNLEDAPHFKHRGPYEWSSLIPRYYSVPTIWADSIIAALVDFERKDLLKSFNIPYLAASCLWMHPKYGKVILRDMYRAFRISGKSSMLGTVQLGLAFFTGPGRLMLKRIARKSRAMVSSEQVETINNINNIVEAVDELLRHLERTERSFRTCVSNTNSKP